MTIKSAKYALEQCHKLRVHTQQLTEAAEMLVLSLDPKSHTTFSEGMKTAAKYQESYHEISALQRKLFCIENILDPQDDTFNEVVAATEKKRG
jgi:hypothetical protein